MSINTNINTIYPAIENMNPAQLKAHMDKIILTLNIIARPAAEAAERDLFLAAAATPAYLNQKATLEKELKNIEISMNRNLNLIAFYTPSSNQDPTIADLARANSLNEENSRLTKNKNILISKISKIDRKLSEVTDKEKDRTALALLVQSYESELVYIRNIVSSRR